LRIKYSQLTAIGIKKGYYFWWPECVVNPLIRIWLNGSPVPDIRQLTIVKKESRVESN
jgi:hypothetical protein